MRFTSYIPALDVLTTQLDGVGGFRTLVQTSNPAAFFTFSFRLFFVAGPAENHQACTYPQLEFETASRSCGSYIYFFGVSGVAAVNQGFHETSQLPALQGLSVTYYNSVTQPRRSYSRRLKSVKYEIYELYPSARRAYNPIRWSRRVSNPRPNKQPSCFLHV